MTENERSSSPSGHSNRRLVVFTILAAAGVFAAYANHFHNSFHFDDGTVIQNNAYLRSLKNIPRFFTDASTFASWAANTVYRPLTSVSFAIDYWRGKGLDPLTFHTTQWTLHLLLGVLVFFFLKHVLADTGLSSRGPWLALFGATLFSIHRVNTEAVNYLTQRSEILATMGVVGSFLFYQYGPRWRRSLLWLLPAALGALAKQSALIFAPLLAIYLLIFPEQRQAEHGTVSDRRWRAWLAAAAPAFVLAVLLYGLQDKLAGPQMLYARGSPVVYLQTQTFAWVHYFRLFFLPLGLSADTDWEPIGDWYDTRVFAGMLFAVLFVSAGLLYARRRPAGRAFLFGSLWFFVSLAPSSSLVPLSEMINEHRPYPAFIGLILCLVAATGDWLSTLEPRRAIRWQRVAAALGILVLIAHGIGTFRRNRVWSTEETLWKSVTEASPGNGRAWMNYGLIFMARADYANARVCFERAGRLQPNYDVLEVNLGILEGASKHPAEAERHFQRAVSLNSNVAVVNFFYGRWLHENRRDREAAAHLIAAIAASPADLEARHLLMRVHEDLGDKESICSLARETLTIAPGDPESDAAAARFCPAR
jgi:protein O-mannosyl-transferase